MTIEIGQKLPEANFIELGAEGPAPVSVADLTAGKKNRPFRCAWRIHPNLPR